MCCLRLIKIVKLGSPVYLVVYLVFQMARSLGFICKIMRSSWCGAGPGGESIDLLPKPPQNKQQWQPAASVRVLLCHHELHGPSIHRTPFKRAKNQDLQHFWRFVCSMSSWLNFGGICNYVERWSS